MPLLIAFHSTSPASGKTTAANYLCREYSFTRLSFATPIKEMVLTLLKSLHISEPREYIWGNLKDAVIPTLGVTSRRLQQTLGTEWGRTLIDPDIWTKAMRREIARCQSSTFREDIVLDDLRFPNEYHLIKSLGGTSYRIHRPGYEKFDPHASEGGLNHIEMPIINNSGGMSELYAQLDAIITTS